MGTSSSVVILILSCSTGLSCSESCPPWIGASCRQQGSDSSNQSCLSECSGSVFSANTCRGRNVPVCQVACMYIDICVSSWCIHMSECVAVCYNEPCRMYESVMCLWMQQQCAAAVCFVPAPVVAWHTYEWVMLHVWMINACVSMRHVARTNESGRTYEWVMSHIY